MFGLYHPGEDRCDAVDGLGILLLALLYLDTGEDDEFARTALDMAEQTCFLHAFCKADLKTRVSIQAYSEDAELPAAIAGSN